MKQKAQEKEKKLVVKNLPNNASIVFLIVLLQPQHWIRTRDEKHNRSIIIRIIIWVHVHPNKNLEPLINRYWMFESFLSSNCAGFLFHQDPGVKEGEYCERFQRKILSEEKWT